MKNIEIYADGVEPNAGYIASLIDVEGIKGFTCNPTLSLAHCNENMSYKDYSQFIISHSNGLPVSVQVLSNEHDEIVAQAIKIDSWGQNVYVKVPIINENGRFNIPAILMLLDLDIKVNVTAIFTIDQVKEFLSYSIPKKSKVILSVFSGRIGDTGRVANDIIGPINKMIDSQSNIKLLWAGVRSMSDIIEARKYCDIITIPQTVLSKLPLKDKDLNDFCRETVQMFANDAKNFKI